MSTLLSYVDPVGDGRSSPRIEIVAASPSMRGILELAERLAVTDVSVLIRGETGTGKELIARAIHAMSPRKEGPFVVVDSGSITPSLIGSELFGYERGAFTGADRRYLGAFERADGGTLFFDEIGELPMAVQPVLLGVLERRRFRRLGGSDDVAVDVRIVAATNRDLRRESEQRRFRSDLYYRMAAGQIHVPPLRERREDILPLVEHFRRRAKRPTSTCAPGTPELAKLIAHSWIGNVRELRNVVEVALATGQLNLDEFVGEEVDTHVAAHPTGGEVVPLSADASGHPSPYKAARAQSLNLFEKRYLGDLMQQCGNNASAAARLACMDRMYLVNLLRKHGLR